LDGHLHIFPERLQRAIYQWFANDGWDIVYQDWYGERIVNYLQDLGCAGAAVLVYAHKPHMAAGLNEWLSHWSQSYPALRLFGTVHPDDPDLPGIVSTALDTYAFAGFKIH
jgi:hypothetical protein